MARPRYMDMVSFSDDEGMDDPSNGLSLGNTPADLSPESSSTSGLQRQTSYDAGGSPLMDLSLASGDVSPYSDSSAFALSDRAKEQSADGPAATISRRGHSSASSGVSVPPDGGATIIRPLKPPLPDEFAERGWELRFGNTHKRWFYLNKRCNNVSVFEAEQVVLYEHIPPLMPLTYSNSHQPLKRKISDASEDGKSGKEQLKMLHLRNNLHDHSILSNVNIPERNPDEILLPPHPDHELKRHAAMKTLRGEFETICKVVLHLSAVPWRILHRWLAWLRANYEGAELLFAMEEAAEGAQEQQEEATISESRVMTEYEAVKLLTDALMQAVPCKAPKESEGVEAIKAYVCAMDSVMKQGDDQFSAVTRRTFTLDRDKFSAVLCTFANANEEQLSRIWEAANILCEKHIRATLRPFCVAAVAKMVANLRQVTVELRQNHVTLLGYCGVSLASTPLPAPEAKTSFCYPVYLRCFTPCLPRIDAYQMQTNTVRFSYKGDAIDISTFAHCKLSLYEHNCADDAKLRLFLARVYAMLLRYDTDMAIAERSDDPLADLPTFRDPLNCGLPTPVLVCLAKILNVTFECFASPLNAYFRQFCSAFGDTDGYFGSRGSFFQFRPVEGSFVAHPPHDEAIIKKTASHILNLLTATKRPMSFVICVPDLQSSVETTSTYAADLKKSEFLKGHICIPAHKYRLVHPFAHLLKYVYATTLPRHDMLVFVLQNAAGERDWPFDKSKSELLEASFGDSQESVQPPPNYQFRPLWSEPGGKAAAASHVTPATT